jgi:GTPase SAR1 family protein
MAKEKKLDIGLFGIAGSGKTVYISMLVYDIRRNRNKEFFVEFESPVAKQYIDDRIEQITVHQAFPEATVFRGEAQVRFAVTRIRNPVRLWFKTIDLPGEIVFELFIPGADGVAFEDPFLRRNQRYRQYVEMIDDLIEKCNGFLFLVDPTPARAAVQDAMVGNIVRSISRRKTDNGGGKLELPIAICMTMWDEYAETNVDPEAYAGKILRVSMNRYAKRLPACKLFTCSSVGSVNYTEVQGERVKIPCESVSPKDVFAPLAWLNKMAEQI